jgi:hypothetical protein
MYQDKDLLEISFLLELEIFDKQGLFLYPFRVLEGYKNHLEGHIIDSKECFEKAIRINPEKPEGYVEPVRRPRPEGDRKDGNRGPRKDFGNKRGPREHKENNAPKGE